MIVPCSSSEPPASPPLTRTSTLTAPSGLCHVPLWRKNCMSGSRAIVDPSLCIPPDQESDPWPHHVISPCDNLRPPRIRSGRCGSLATTETYSSHLRLRR